eukprot:CAMPEP_0204517680 /NCGR_PEP_ID=MMETSP0661-20131031/3800_1 /ASSEMBLY_ACC=CAM_ASM_000606 /TAXON_ID=109239 /ORGANISM="Alexandrium margalefi, Strain AMGDE01CS-322" /LENGTH=69 /DNA_ID=CAMNT_0051523091 /DNA_START=1 /DNA_END=210 /DNA_ORIENTATION=+
MQEVVPHQLSNPLAGGPIKPGTLIDLSVTNVPARLQLITRLQMTMSCTQHLPCADPAKKREESPGQCWH